MPIYEYRCDSCGTSFEVMQRMSDDPLEACDKCGGELRKVLHPVAIHFKGSGFYTTDYGKGSGRRTGGSDAAAEPASTGSDSGSGSGTTDSGTAKASDSGSASGKTSGKPKEKQKAS